MELDGPVRHCVSELTMTLERERELIEELHRAVLTQRDAMARGDGPGVETSIRAAGRALLTLEETRRTRAALLESLVGDASQPLVGLEAYFAPGLPEAFLTARREVYRSATAVARDVWRNEEMLVQALAVRDAMVQELLTGRRPRLPSEPGSASREEE